MNNDELKYTEYLVEKFYNTIKYTEYLANNFNINDYWYPPETESEKAERIRLMRSKKLNRIFNEMDI